MYRTQVTRTAKSKKTLKNSRITLNEAFGLALTRSRRIIINATSVEAFLALEFPHLDFSTGRP